MASVLASGGWEHPLANNERSSGGGSRNRDRAHAPVAGTEAAANQFLALFLQLAALAEQFLLGPLQFLLDLSIEPVQFGGPPLEGCLGALQGEPALVHLPAPCLPSGLLLAPSPPAGFQRLLEVDNPLARLLCRCLHPLRLGDVRLEPLLLGKRLLTQRVKVALGDLLVQHALE